MSALLTTRTKLFHTKVRMTNSSSSFWQLQVSKVEVDEPSHSYLPETERPGGGAGGATQLGLGPQTCSANA